MYRNLTEHDFELREVVADKIALFKRNINDTRLRDHALRKRLKGKRAFSITHDLRIVYEKIGVNAVCFLSIGTHTQVYSRKKKS